MQEEPVGDQHQVAVGPMLPRELDMLDELRIEKWFAAE